MKHFIILLILFFTLNSICANNMDKIKENYKNLLLSEQEELLIKELRKLEKEKIISDQVVRELTERYPPKGKEVQDLLNKLTDNGMWTDVNYAAKNRSNWTPGTHATRILFLAKVYRTPDQEFYNSTALLEAIHLAFNYWIEAKLVSPNWWHNQIGVPRSIGSAAILMEDKLTDAERGGIINIMNNAKFGMTGQNKVWLAGNVLMRALLENDEKLVKQAKDTIFSEIVIGYGDKEGIKSDWSYHQHGAQQQFGNYGSAYLSTMSLWISTFKGTSMAASQDQLDILYSLVNNGYQRILWKGYMDMTALGRQYFKQAQRHKGLATMFATNMFAQADEKNRAGYMKIIDANLTNTQTVAGSGTGLYHFWKSDQTVQRTPRWMTSVKMSSTRVIGAEAGNGDNLQGYYLGDGAMYTYINGDEYHDIFACWNWKQIPGVTSHLSDKPLKPISWSGIPNNSDFVGNVSKENYGLSVMNINRDGLAARKAWLFTPEYTLCLGMGITTDSLCKVNTSVEQSLKKSDLLYLENEKWTTVTESKAMKNKNDVKHYHHNSVGYIVLNGANGEASNESRTKSWSTVMDAYPADDMNTKNIVSIQIDHGMSPKNASYQYLVAPMVTPLEVENFDLNNIKVLHNDKDVQMVHLIKENKIFIASYTPLSIEIEKGLKFTTSQPGLFILFRKGKEWLVTVSDPTQKLKSITVSLGSKTIEMPLPDGEKKGTSLSVSL